MTKNAAIKQARKAHSRVIRSGACSYVYFCPYDLGKPEGPSAESKHTDFFKAARSRKRSVAAMALRLLGWPSYDADARTAWADGSVESIVSAALARGYRKIAVELDRGANGVRFRLSDEADERNGGWSSTFKNRDDAMSMARWYVRTQRSDLDSKNVEYPA